MATVFVTLDIGQVTLQGLPVTPILGTIVDLDVARVSLKSSRVSIYHTENYGPAAGIAVAKTEATWIALDNDRTRVAYGSMIPHATLRQGQRADYVARVTDSQGAYPTKGRVEAMSLYVYDESSDTPTTPVHTDDLEVEDNWFDDLQVDGYSRDVAGGYNLRFPLDDETVRFEGGHSYRIEVLVTLTDREDQIPVIWRVTATPVWAITAD